jgi:hypothetical protein
MIKGERCEVWGFEIGFRDFRVSGIQGVGFRVYRVLGLG